MEKCSIKILDPTVGLGVAHRGKVLFDPKIFVPCLERVIRKLLPVVRDDYPRQTKATNYTLPKEFLDGQAITHFVK